MSAATTSDLVIRIDACLPQTQCTRCGYPRCRDYASAIAEGRADINRCPPGGDTTLQTLAQLMQVPPKPLDPTCGTHTPRTRAIIDEAVCIGCRKCIDACPVDAIVGARKLMHTVIAAECTGCELCVPPCPVDCIAMIPATSSESGRWPEYGERETTHWRARTEARLARLAQRKAKAKSPRSSIFPDRDTIRADIRAALERARRKKPIQPR